MSEAMLKKMKFVQGSVAKKDLLPALTHFRIENGRIQGYNGHIALSTPIDFDVDCTPKAIPLVNAIGRCVETIQLGMTKAGKLSVKSGKFRTYIECIEGPTAHVQPDGAFVDVDGEQLLKALKILQPFIADDAARPWSNGVHFSGASAYATNNVVIAEHWLGSPFPVKVTVPRVAVKEIIRIGRAPVRFQMSDQSLTLHYEDESWLRCNLITGEWPDVEKFFAAPANPVAVPEDFFRGLEDLKPFVDKFNRIIMEPGLMRTHSLEFEEGAAFELDWITNKSTFSLPMLQKLHGVATKMDLSAYPNPCQWYGEDVRGVIVGLHWIEGEL